MEEMNSLLRSPVVAYGGGSLIVRRATKIKHVFFLLAGGVERSNGIRPEQTLPSGSLIGVVDLVDEESDATWRATSPVRRRRINVYTFMSFFLNGGWYGLPRTDRADTAFLRTTRLSSST